MLLFTITLRKCWYLCQDLWWWAISKNSRVFNFAIFLNSRKFHAREIYTVYSIHYHYWNGAGPSTHFIPQSCQILDCFIETKQFTLNTEITHKQRSTDGDAKIKYEKVSSKYISWNWNCTHHRHVADIKAPSISVNFHLQLTINSSVGQCIYSHTTTTIHSSCLFR